MNLRNILLVPSISIMLFLFTGHATGSSINEDQKKEYFKDIKELSSSKIFSSKGGIVDSLNYYTGFASGLVVHEGKSSPKSEYSPKHIYAQEQNTANHLKKVDIKSLPTDLGVRVGGSRKDVERTYGQPSSNEVLPNYNPPVMRKLVYKNLGLTFFFFRNLLWGIEVKDPFQGKFFGVKIGDPVSRAIALYGYKGMTGTSPLANRPPHFYKWWNRIPECTLKVHVKNNRNWEEEKNPIVGFSFTDSSKRGKWFSTFK